MTLSIYIVIRKPYQSDTTQRQVYNRRKGITGWVGGWKDQEWVGGRRGERGGGTLRVVM